MEAKRELACGTAAPQGLEGSEGHVELVVLQLNGICKAATFDFALAVGEVIIRQFYGGDLHRWRARTNKDVSLRALARHPNLPMSPSALYRSIAMYELCERLGIRSCGHVSTSHIRLVLPLDIDEQARLLQLADSNAWTVRRLDEEVQLTIASRRPSSAGRGGRSRQSALSEAMRVVRRCIEVLRESLDADDVLAAGADRSLESTRTAIELLQRAGRTCALLEARLSRALPEATSTAPPASPEALKAVRIAVGREA